MEAMAITIKQLKAIKAQMQAQKRTKNPPKAQSKANTQASTKNAKKANKRHFLKAPQISRMFDQTNASIENCKRAFPNDYHHKHALKAECEQVAQMLDDGGLLLAQLVQLVGYQTLTAEQKTALSNFKTARLYLTGNLRTTAKHVAAVEDGTAKKCYSARFVKGEVKHEEGKK